MVLDYLSDAEPLRNFYEYSPDLEGIKKSLEQKKTHYTQRAVLYQLLKDQYANLEIDEAVRLNLERIAEDNTFTICTAHQPCLFTGPLYFIYKILHACKLAHFLQQQFPDCHFVPIYYMGSEDADLEEVGSVDIGGVKYTWNTSQKGAVGRMKVDEALVKLLHQLEQQLSGLPNAAGVMLLLRKHFVLGTSIANATFQLVNELFQEYGLLILQPDAKAVKLAFLPFMEKELKEGFSHHALKQTIHQFPDQYKVQVQGRAINLFYLQDNSRERIDKIENEFHFLQSNINLTEHGIMAKLHAEPECFSPNVVLRPLLQEYLLPNVAFIGGGGELAYWLELKSVFAAAQIPYPVLVLRNSFCVVDSSLQKELVKLGLTATDFFRPLPDLVKWWMSEKHINEHDLSGAISKMDQLYKDLEQQASRVDVTLQRHVIALKVASENKIKQLEKKLLRSLKKKHEVEIRKLEKLHALFYPGGALQERSQNYFFLQAGKTEELISVFFECSNSLEQQFCVLTIA